MSKDAISLQHDYFSVFETDVGQRVLTDLMTRYNVFGSVKGQSIEDTYYNEGQRNVVLDIMKKLSVTPEQLQKLLKQRVRVN